MNFGLKGYIAVTAGKIAALTSRTLGKGSGGMIGGRVAQKICPDIMSRLAAGKKVALVTGTNGKSTTTKMLVNALQQTGKSVATNRGGDNMENGVIAAMMDNISAPYVVLEVDEMHVPLVAAEVKPQVLLYLNLSRDQLDRVGAVGHVEERLRQAVAISPQATVVANCDDPMVTSAAWDGKEKVWVSVGTRWIDDSLVCPRSGKEIKREGEDWFSTGEPTFRRPQPAWSYQVEESGFGAGEAVMAGSAMEVSAPQGKQSVVVNLPGMVNRGNALMALAAANVLGAPLAAAAQGIPLVTEVAGRYASCQVGQVKGHLLLAKNPAGWREALTMRHTGAAGAILAVNARIGDGTDPSWVEDIDFTPLCDTPKVIVSGECADKVQACLEKQGIACEVENNAYRAISLFGSGEIDILANYTAFQDLRAELESKGQIK
ncbi:MurT ligase domain-containing protein [Varibaculum vaginae]|uniref:MurT ligase domain-containing protein n=1 Tax=Varibaculum vaginae TaxID=2364797 RepID=UPI000F07762A|nr:MurT ligase domain-containing protein [Varibaculum vaginae]